MGNRWANQESAQTAGRNISGSGRHECFVPTGLVVLALVLCSFFIFVLTPHVSAAPPDTKPNALFEALEPQAQNIDFSKFYHNNANHARLPCLLCHRRTDATSKPTLPGGGQHLPCAGCHAKEFTNSASPVCSICHTNPESGMLKAFPPLKSFSVKFDHSVHARELRVSCATCHRPVRNGQALSIPTGPGAHTTCYQCHGPQAKANGRDISSCGTCHQPGSYARPSLKSAAFQVGFNHAKHTSRQISCSECHNVRAGMAQRKQVTGPLALNHHAPPGVSSCASCHNGKRAFGGDDFSACARCHRGPQWHF